LTLKRPQAITPFYRLTTFVVTMAVVMFSVIELVYMRNDETSGC